MNDLRKKNGDLRLQELITEVLQSPWMDALLPAPGREVLRRARAIFQALRTPPRSTRRRWQRKLATSLAGASLMLALHSTPAQAENIIVNGGCTLVDAITAANTDLALGGARKETLVSIQSLCPQTARRH